MGVLKFTYGVMGSSKSAQALILRHNYDSIGYNVILAKPNIDNRWDTEERLITSRIGISAKCKVFDKDDNLINLYLANMDALRPTLIIIDEAQFCTAKQINQLKRLSRKIDVFCYGLKTNFKSELFEGSKRLLEIADVVEEIPHICKCGKKAMINARIVDGKPTVKGEEIVLGGEEKYEAMCYDCFVKRAGIEKDYDTDYGKDYCKENERGI